MYGDTAAGATIRARRVGCWAGSDHRHPLPAACYILLICPVAAERKVTLASSISAQTLLSNRTQCANSSSMSFFEVHHSHALGASCRLCTIRAPELVLLPSAFINPWLPSPYCDMRVRGENFSLPQTYSNLVTVNLRRGTPVDPHVVFGATYSNVCAQCGKSDALVICEDGRCR